MKFSVEFINVIKTINLIPKTCTSVKLNKVWYGLRRHTL